MLQTDGRGADHFVAPVGATAGVAGAGGGLPPAGGAPPGAAPIWII